MPTRRLEVGAEAAGERLDAFLAGPLGSRSQAQRLIDAGQVTVDGGARAKNHRVAAGEQVEIAEPEPPVAPSSTVPVAVAYEDDAVLVADKPAGVVVHGGAGITGPTLVDALAGRVAGGPDPQRPGVVHRLDRDTSGLLVLARTEDAYIVLQRAMARREIEREYVALVEGVPPARSGLIDAPIGRDRRVRTRMSTDTDAPREARTRFELEREVGEGAAALLRVRLETGRTHQVRVHLAAIGHPVAGDPEYGTAGRFGLERQFLHAARLAFDHPVSRARVELASALPPDLERVLRQLDAEKPAP
jgi:23S rRNA pseudouridine1911/1915/1917 synthase